jgi:hypothetical protein
MNNCQHNNRIGDNYGVSCQDCGERLSGFGCGGWFGANLQVGVQCIHVFAPMGEDSAEVCIYCEQWRKSPNLTESLSGEKEG